MHKYVRESALRSQSRQKEKLLFNSIPVLIKDPLPEEIDVDNVLSQVEERIPKEFLENVDGIYIGDFEVFRQKQTNAAYENGALYVSNEQDDLQDMVDDIVHESAHALEDQHWQEIYADGEIEQEFVGKRQRLFHIFKEEGLDIPEEIMLNVEYSASFDKLLYEDIGYEALSSFAMGLFVSPYGITSLREYFANAYEHYFLDEASYVKKISPQVYKKIEEIHILRVYNNEEQ